MQTNPWDVLINDILTPKPSRKEIIREFTEKTVYECLSTLPITSVKKHSSAEKDRETHCFHCTIQDKPYKIKASKIIMNNGIIHSPFYHVLVKNGDSLVCSFWNNLAAENFFNKAEKEYWKNNPGRTR